MQTVIIAGPPGCGKGTQAKLIAKHLGFEHISTGDILRREILASTDLGKLAQAKIDDGNFVPDNVACEMITNFIKNNQHIKGMVLDGFPRTKNQCLEFDKLIKQIKITNNICISIVVDENKLKSRLLNRNEKYNRPDDSSIEIIEHRLRLYQERTKSVTDYYINIGQCELVNGNGNVDEVFYNIKTVIDKYLEII
ncbi:MAG: adenylate kinase [Bacteroidales bacterium]|jgi:adenylate kinase|nr:adenylate kinase [Bacteroidales bacterium]MDD4218448.1 adenylate kinase [Bacteroidales bacterium]MDY0140708.1 adenylate kinase [Bacteroidales bacterium]